MTSIIQTNNNETSLDIVRKKILGQRIKCTLKDGRITSGTLICLDRLKNMILVNALEERKVCKTCYAIGDEDQNEEKEEEPIGENGRMKEAEEGLSMCINEREYDGGRYYVFCRDISQVLIPGEQLVKVEISHDIIL